MASNQCNCSDQEQYIPDKESFNYLRMIPHLHGYKKYKRSYEDTTAAQSSKCEKPRSNSCNCPKCREKRYSRTDPSYAHAHTDRCPVNRQPSNKHQNSSCRQYRTYKSSNQIYPSINPRMNRKESTSIFPKHKPANACENCCNDKCPRNFKNVVVLYNAKQKQKCSKSKTSFVSCLGRSSSDFGAYECSSNTGTDRHELCYDDAQDWSHINDNYPSRYKFAACELEKERKWREKHYHYNNSILERKSEKSGTCRLPPPKKKRPPPEVKCECAQPTSKVLSKSKEKKCPRSIKKKSTNPCDNNAVVITKKKDVCVPDYLLGKKKNGNKNCQNGNKTAEKKATSKNKNCKCE